MSEQLVAPLLDYANGSTPITIALSRLLMDCASEAEARRALDTAMTSSALHGGATERLLALRGLWDRHPNALATVRTTLDRLSDPGGGRFSVADWGKAFDRVVDNSPEASVAIYSLGSPGILAAATDEVRDWMLGCNLLGPHRDGLDLGCGIGRFVGAMAPHLRSVVGIDVSAGMVAEAGRRCAALANARILHASGRSLDVIATGSMDLVLASDVFPYLVDVGGDLARTHVVECSRILRPGGHLLILNYAYAGADAHHAEVLTTDSSATGLRLTKVAERPFRQWDAAVYLLEQSGRQDHARFRA